MGDPADRPARRQVGAKPGPQRAPAGGGGGGTFNIWHGKKTGRQEKELLQSSTRYRCSPLPPSLPPSPTPTAPTDLLPPLHTHLPFLTNSLIAFPYRQREEADTIFLFGHYCCHPPPRTVSTASTLHHHQLTIYTGAILPGTAGGPWRAAERASAYTLRRGDAQR